MRITNLISYLAAKNFLLFILFLFSGYTLLEKGGLFRLEVAGYREVFFSTPVRVTSILLALNAIAAITMGIKRFKGWGRSGMLAFYTGILLMVASLWVSYYTRFEGNFVRAEGQSFSGFKGDYIPETLHMPYDRDLLPQVGIAIHRILPEAAENMERLEKLSAGISYASRTTDKVIDRDISSDELFISDWAKISFEDFGYVVPFALLDEAGGEIEKQNLSMKLFPPGAEESSQFKYLGYLFYFRLYPDYIDEDGKPKTRSAELKNPVLNLRVIRNKDIVYSGLVRPGEKINIETITVSIPEVKMWVEMRLVRDFGIPVLTAGITFIVIGVGMVLIGRKKIRNDL